MTNKVESEVVKANVSASKPAIRFKNALASTTAVNSSSVSNGILMQTKYSLLVTLKVNTWSLALSFKFEAVLPSVANKIFVAISLKSFNLIIISVYDPFTFILYNKLE